MIVEYISPANLFNFHVFFYFVIFLLFFYDNYNIVMVSAMYQHESAISF